MPLLVAIYGTDALCQRCAVSTGRARVDASQSDTKASDLLPLATSTSSVLASSDALCS